MKKLLYIFTTFINIGLSLNLNAAVMDIDNAEEKILTQNITLKGHESSINSKVISHDDSFFIVTGLWDKTVKIRDTKTGELIKILEGHTGIITSLAISHDDSFIVTGSWDKTVKIWNAKTGELINTLIGHNGPIESLAISHDDSFIVTGSHDRTVKIWDTKTGQLIKTLIDNIDNTDFIKSVVISSDDSFIETVSYNRTVKIWDIKTGKLIKLLKGHESSINSVDINSDYSFPYIDHDEHFTIAGSYDKI